MSAAELKSGVYRHYADGRFYQVLFVATCTQFDTAPINRADLDLLVYAESGTSRHPKPWGPYVVINEPTADIPHILRLFVARSHGPLKYDTKVAVYVPLYHDKPGRRISVRAVDEFNERIATPCKVGFADGCTTDPAKGHYVNRFTYVGDTVPGST